MMNLEGLESRQYDIATKFYEDYVKYGSGEDFEEIMSKLGNPVDKEEVKILAKAVFDILRRRNQILIAARKISVLIGKVEE